MANSLHTLARPFLFALCVSGVVVAIAAGEKTPRRLDPAAWGGDHVGKPFPEYLTGDECLFCHRRIGAAWGDNRHQLTIRPATPDDPALKALGRSDGGNEIAGDVDYLMGSGRITRYLRRSTDYGKLDLLSTFFRPALPTRPDPPQPPPEDNGGKLHDGASPKWDHNAFGDRCAGCHATAVNHRTKSFAALSLDCFSCHGNVPLGHTKDTRLVLLSSKTREPRQIVSLCGQCHLRGGKSQNSGRPYPNTFVAGDNLFLDFKVDLSEAVIETLPAVDRHVYLSTRDVALFGRESADCLTCHDVHARSTEKHRKLSQAAICSSCHPSNLDHSQLRDELLPAGKRRARSRICGY